jgi:hypothetical protein
VIIVHPSKNLQEERRIHSYSTPLPISPPKKHSSQLVYAFLVGSFPFNSFLASFFCCLSGFVLTICLRMQADPLNSIAEGMNKSPERSFADYVLAMCVMFLAVWNYIG